MKFSEASQFHNFLLILLGPALLTCIFFAAKHMLTTYTQVENSRQELLWSALQLNKELNNTHFLSVGYIHGLSSAKELRMAYEILWSRLPITISSLKKDETYNRIYANNPDPLINNLFKHVKSIESIMMSQDAIDTRSLKTWSDALLQYQQLIHISLVHNIASTKSIYSQLTTKKILNTAIIMAFVTICFILYLAYLLSALWNESKLSRHLLDHDSLTGLASRDYTLNKLESYCKSSTPITLLAFDLNKFKLVNDTLGHHAGDKLLQHFAKQLQLSFCKEGIAGRVGGDEFLWVSTITDKALINHYYGDFLLALKEPCLIDDEKIYLKVSTGAGISSDCDFHPARLMEHVDRCMYTAKQLQFKTICWFDADEKIKVMPPKLKALEPAIP